MIEFFEDFAFGILEEQTDKPWLLNITIASAKMWGRKSEIIYGKTVDEILKKFEEYEYKQKYLIIQSPGHFIHSKAFFYSIQEDLVKSLFLGHVLLGDLGRAPTLHKQCIAVNIDAWRHQSKPKFDAIAKLQFPIMEYPKGCHHDNYTPKEITHTGLYSKYPVEAYPGSLWILKQLENYKICYTFNGSARNSKFNIYTHTEEAYEDSIKRLEYLQKQFKKTVYFHETDTINKEHNKNVTTLVTVASGLRVPRYLNIYPNLKHIIVYDISYYALEFQRRLRNFDEQYESLIENFKQKYPHCRGIPPAHKSSKTYGEYYIMFMDEIPNSIEKRERWKKVDTDFILADLIDEYDQVISLINDDENVVFDVSNVYTMPLNYVHMTSEDMVRAMNKMISLLANKTQNYRIIGFSPSWVPLS